MSDLAIVIPVYKEGELITRTIYTLFSKVKVPFKAYFIYDFEEDPTPPYVRSYNDPRLVLLRNKYGRGVLGAIKTGFELTKEDKVIVYMADMSEDPMYINDMLNKAKEGFDIVCGSRYMKGGAQIGAPKFKSFLSRMAGLSLKLLTGIPTHDVSNSFKLYSRKVLDAITIESDGGFELGLEILVKAHVQGFKIAEVPVVWKERESGKSNFKLLKWLPKYLKWYFYLIRKAIFRR